MELVCVGSTSDMTFITQMFWNVSIHHLFMILQVAKERFWGATRVSTCFVGGLPLKLDNNTIAVLRLRGISESSRTTPYAVLAWLGDQDMVLLIDELNKVELDRDIENFLRTSASFQDDTMCFLPIWHFIQCDRRFDDFETTFLELPISQRY